MSGPTVASQNVCCCYARTWASVIGWLQTIGNALALLSCTILFILSLIALANKDEIKDGLTGGNKDNVDAGIGILLAISVIGIIIYSVGLAAGIILIMGVKEQNPNKLKTWLIIVAIFFGFTMIRFILQIVVGGYFYVTSDIIGILINIFFIWVVVIHKNELVTAGKARTIYENERSLQ